MSHLEWYGERRCSPSGTGRGRTFGKRDAHPALRKRQLTINGQVLRLANPTTGRLVACTGQAEGGEDRGLKRGEKRVVIVQKSTKLRLGFRFWPAPGNETKEHSRSKYGNFSLLRRIDNWRAEQSVTVTRRQLLLLLAISAVAGWRVVVVEQCQQHLCASSSVPSALPLRSKGRSRRSQGSKSDALSS